MLNAPVLFLIFNRPDLTERVFNEIRLAKPAKIFVAADGPRVGKAGEADLCEQTRNVVLNNIDWNCKVYTLLRDQNLGCKIAVSTAITWFFENVEEGIILEDDILPDQSFFKYCEEMLVKYKHDPQITQVAGGNLMDARIGDDSYFFSKVGGIWGWATWARAWKNYDLEIKSWGDKATRNEVKRYLGKKDWFDRLKGNFDMVYNKQYDTWDFQWVYMQLRTQSLSIMPAVNLISNIGFRADATHTVNRNEFIESKMKAKRLDLPLIHPTKIIPNDEYLTYCLNLLSKNPPAYKEILGKIKRKVKRVLGM